MAGAAGIEPAVPVLETGGLPLTDAPKKRAKEIFGLFTTIRMENILHSVKRKSFILSVYVRYAYHRKNNTSYSPFYPDVSFYSSSLNNYALYILYMPK